MSEAKMSKKPQKIQQDQPAREETYPEIVRRLQQRAEEDRETFRSEAQEALQMFTPDDREVASNLIGDTVAIEDVLEAWHKKFIPIKKELEQKRSDQGFKKALENNLHLSPSRAHHKVEALINERQDDLLYQVIDELYPLESSELADQREQATDLFLESVEVVEDFRKRYLAFASHIEAADLVGVTIYDPYASWLERRRFKKRVRKEQEQLERDESERLITISQQKDELAAAHHGLVGEIVQYGWNPKELEKLYEGFEKKFKKLSKKDQKSPRKRIETFEKATHDFRDTQTHKVTELSGARGLKEIRKVAEEVDRTLSQYFDLEADAREQITAQIEEYNTLDAEQEKLEQKGQKRLDAEGFFAEA